MPDIQVRLATLEDLAELTSLFDAYRVFYEQESDLELAREFIHERLHNNESHLLIARSSSGEAIGFAQLYPSFSSVRAGRILILNDLFVSETARQRGVGRALLNACETFGLQQGVLSLKLETHRTNTVAQALYVEQGWEEDREYCTYYLPLGALEQDHG